MQLNRELFNLELANLSDLSRFLNWEISHLQTIFDLASQLRRLISVQEYKPAAEVRQQLEQMLTP
jgi:protein-arginine kinase activator protein McsA